MPRYRFGDFVISTRQRVLLRNGQEQPLIPRYFDLLVFLVERRHDAVHRRDIFDRVWTDVTVSDSALSQAIRTIRRVLGDDSREPRFIATVSRHGYRFIFADVREEEDGPEPHPAAALPALPAPAAVSTSLWAATAVPAALTGAAAGVLGGAVLASMPEGASSFAVVPALGLVGACCGGIGGAGVGAGLSATGASRSHHLLGLVLGGAAGGGAVGTAVQWLARWSLAALVGVRLEIGGGIEGLVIGAAAGLAYGLATRGPAPAAQARVLGMTATGCALAALLLTSLGRPLVGGTIHRIASGSSGAQAALTPIGRLLGEPTFGPVSSAILGTAEGLLFGLGVAIGLSRQHLPE